MFSGDDGSNGKYVPGPMSKDRVSGAPFGVRAALAGAVLLLGVGTGAEADETGAFEIVRSATVDHPLLVLPRRSAAGAASADGWRLSATEEDGFRVYRAARGDRVRTVRVAASMPRHVAFNPAAGRFEHLAQSVRVELRDPGALDRVVEAAGGSSGKAYPLLGFALVHLPAGADPVSAARSIMELPVVASARLIVRGPRRKPR